MACLRSRGIKESLSLFNDEAKGFWQGQKPLACISSRERGWVSLQTLSARTLSASAPQVAFILARISDAVLAGALVS
jgi:hypothetical protein